MLKIVISGCNGRMGRAVTAMTQDDPDLEIAAGFDINAVKYSYFPVYADPMEYQGAADAIIDFSSPAALDSLLPYAVRRGIPLVLATTGYNAGQQYQVERASEKIPVFQTGNLSLGVNLLVELVRRAAAVLGSGFDIEIVERHHNRKTDAPSGTALMLAKAASDSRSDIGEYVYDRHSAAQARKRSEIGISSVRGGSIIGDHEVIFAGADEVLELHHHAASREIFAAGAIKAVKFIASRKECGLYSMKHLLSSI